MPTESLRRFLPSLQTAQLAVRSLEHDAPRLDITKTKLPWPTITHGPSIHFILRPRCFPDYELVRENLGETAEAQLELLAQYYAPKTGSLDLVVLTSDKRFTQDLTDCITELLGMDYKQPTYSSFLNAYGKELYDWLCQPHEHHLTKLKPNGNIYLHCEREPLDISPLED